MRDGVAVINVDIDGVLYDFVGAMQHELALAGYDPLPIDPLLSLHGTYGITRETFEEIMFEGIKKGRVFGPSYPNRVIRGAKEAMWRLWDQYFIRLVTMKSGFPDPLRAYAIRNCVEWLADNKIPYDDIAFVQGHKLDYPADVVIDDRPEPTRWAQRRALNLLFTQQHNVLLNEREWDDRFRAAKEGRPAIRVDNWQEAVLRIERRFAS